MRETRDTTAIEHTARQLLDARIAAVRELAKAQVARDRARDALGTAETDHASVYAAATRVGWSDSELKQIGLTAPARRSPGRPRRARVSASQTTTPPGAGSAGGLPHHDREQTANGG